MTDAKGEPMTNSDQPQVAWNDIFSNGSVIDLSVSSWRARVKIQPTDLGIEDTPEVRKTLSLGTHKLAPAAAFGRIEAAANAAAKAVAHYSVPFALIRGASFVPEANLKPCLEELRAAQAAHERACDAFAAAYAETKAAQIPELEKAIQQASRDPDVAAKAVERLKAEYPTDVRGKFSLTWVVYGVQSPQSKVLGDAANEEAQNVRTVMQDVVERLRTELGERVGKLVEMVERGGGRLGKQSIGPTEALLDRLDSLNFVKDAGLTAQVEAVRRLVAGADAIEEKQGLALGLRDVAQALTEGTAEAVADAEARMAGLGRRKLSLVNAGAAEVR